MSNLDMDDVKRRMEGSVSNYTTELGGLRAGRATTAMLEPVSVDAYGARMPLNQVSNISVPEPRMLTVSVWDAGLVAATEKAIRDSGLGLNPMAEGNVIRVAVPDLSEDRRKELVKVAGKYAESARIAVRNIRRDAIEVVRKDEKSSAISEDERHNLEATIQKATDEFVAKIDALLAEKENDITQV
ncbi:MAG: ribosome recycling factor [Candidatus Puniceispirillaceae bacterium]